MDADLESYWLHLFEMGYTKFQTTTWILARRGFTRLLEALP